MEREKSEKRIISEYIFRGLNFKAVNLVGLQKKTKGGAPFLVLEFKGVKRKAELAVTEELETVWKETLEWDLHAYDLQPTDYVKIKIFEQEKYWKNRLLGKAKLFLESLVESKENKIHVDVNLTDGYGNPTEYKFSCDLEYTCPTSNGTEADNDKENGQEDAETDSTKEGRDSKRSDEIKKQRFSLPDKPLDFQIRIKVIEARQLEGNDINPVIRVTVGNKRRQTRVRQSTNRPYYNQTLFYSFSSITPNELFSKEIKFEVFNSRLLRSDSLIGVFKCDVGFVYDSKDHSLLRKWLVLTEPDEHETVIKGQEQSATTQDETQDSGGTLAGYVKTSMVVLQPGATAPSLEDIGKNSDDDDIETNLLHSPGVALTPAVFMLRVYRAEDLPQMDSAFVQNVKKTLRIRKHPKDLVDPYCVVNFAGIKATSETIYSSNNPTFNEILNVPFQFPSMCDKLKIQLVDWDRVTADDIIGTKYLPLSEISGNGGAGRVKRTLKLPKDKFVEPVGWKFDGSWFINPELSTHYSKDTGHKWFLEDAFQNEYRMYPGGKWLPTTDSPWADIHGETLIDEQGNAIQSVDAIKPPKGWDWSSKDGWKVDLNRAVDQDGWEYAIETTLGSTNFEAVEKKYHFCRRRRLVRERQSVVDINQKRDSALNPPEDTSKSKDGWEYAKAFTTRFHSKRKGFDMVRRRRWHRKLVREDPNASEPVFNLTVGKSKDEEEPVLNAPRIFLYFKKPLLCQLRAHIFQARNLLPSDPNGLADPYIQLSFGTRSATSKIIFKKLNPTWDQMLVLENVAVYGHYDQVTENPPDVLLEIFDYDPVGRHEFLGRIQTEPVVFIPDQEDTPPTTKLSWHKVWNGSEHCGDVLAAFELFVEEELCAPSLPTLTNGVYTIPPEIRPVVQRTAVEVLCWGVRNLKRFHAMNVKSPIVEIEIGGEVKKTSVLKNIKKNPNFEDDRILHFDVDLPKDDLYTPPITIRVRDSRSFGRNPTVGVCVIESARIFRGKEPLSPLVEGGEQASFDYSTIDLEQDGLNEVNNDEEKESIDWWSKYYASRPDTHTKSIDYPEHFDKLKVYYHELEKEFDKFQDFIKTFPLRRGKFKCVEEDEDDSTVGEFKGTLCIYSLPEDRKVPLPPRIFKEERLPRAKPVNCIVRVYIVRVYDLTPQDLNGLADPYLVVSLGKQCCDDRENYAHNTLEVDFGKMFEFQARIPVVKDLKIKVIDYDMVSSDDLIGETVIDLENRLLSLGHAIAGLPSTYTISGPNKWRLGSGYTPTVILENYCKYNNLPPPRYNGSNLILVNGNAYSLDEFEPDASEDKNLGPERERLALHILHSFQSLVPEHVETRELMSSLHPGFSQGKLEMFVDIFPDYMGQPGPPIDISPRKPKKYELRVIVWNTKDVYLQESNLAGENMSDIYVKCWMAGINKKQSTDTHYRSLNGEGMFNWRMIFPFEYMDAEKLLLVKRKDHFWSLNKRAEKVRPQLGIQVWDNDLISKDDFIGSVVLDLENLPIPFNNPSKIKDHHALVNRECGSLFEQRRFYGWWPVTGKVKVKKKGRSKKKKEKITKLTGKVELTIELLDCDEAESKPAGKGHDEPNQHPALKKPKRPETSFLWIANPWKSFRFVIWRNYKWYIIGFIVLALIVLLVGLFIYSAPGYSVKKIMNT
ncbi:myoferlin-like isoform X2 [Paramuricea clavata]|uniref:Myoferlin-like isoform X2 n=1 Tax=Paramuricea clavata TaxID=317549 RepID=A0A7D9DVU7_PARCT|nr:myoferlin-like isoform X2 [Paramuricea clavata]